MLLSVGPNPEFLKFVQVLSWIVVPILVSAVLLTFYMHYRRKKLDAKNTKKTEDEFIQASPEQIGYTKGDGEYVLFDHSQLIHEYKERLTSTHARFKALQHDFADMEEKYRALAIYTQSIAINNKKGTMENLQGQIPKHLQAEINKLAKDHATEKKELLEMVEVLGASFIALEQENKSLTEQISISTGSDKERAAIMKKWKEENNALRDKVAEQEYIKDVLEEKKAQIAFLQQQLEQRIKNQHQADQQKDQIATEAEQIKENNHFIYQQAEVFKSELQLKQDQADKLQSVICEKEELLNEKDQVLASRQNQIVYLDKMLNESNGQNKILQSRVELLERKLLANNPSIHKEVYGDMEAENEISPDLALSPDYGSNGQTPGAFS